MNKPRYSVRVTPNQSLVLQEIAEALDTTISLLIRTIIGDWLTKNEEYIENIIDKKKQDAYNKSLEEEAQKHISQ